MKEQPLINIEVAKNVIATMKPTFDSHDFLTLFILTHTMEYLVLLRRYHSVETTHTQVGKFLLDKSDELYIRKIGESESENIFGNITPCGLWERR